jgi:hypothetical protein
MQCNRMPHMKTFIFEKVCPKVQSFLLDNVFQAEWPQVGLVKPFAIAYHAAVGFAQNSTSIQNTQGITRCFVRN